MFLVDAGERDDIASRKKCSTCKIRKAKAAGQIMAPLPQIQLVLPLGAFSRCVVDFGGPFLTKQGREKKEQNSICVFTCLVSYTVHLEIAYGLDADSFLNAFYRMTNRRELAVEMLSDNGKNFVGGEQELRELIEKLDAEKIVASGADKGIKWNFNPPLAPHFGGVHESMMKSAKKAIKAITGNVDVNNEELMPIFTAAESLLNSQPLTYQTSNPEDETLLTLNHFLHGQIGGQFAPSTVYETQFHLKK